MIEFISKEEAKRRIDESPLDGVFWNTIDRTTYIHSNPQKIEKERGKELINMAKLVSYQDNVFFGMLLLEGILTEKDTSYIYHNLLFPQLK